MIKPLNNIPIKQLKIIDNNLRISRLKTQLNFLEYCYNIELEYNICLKLQKFFKKSKYIFYKFTGHINKNMNYKQYKILYTFKYLKYKLKLKNKSLKILYKLCQQ